MILQYVDDEGVPSIVDTAFVSAKTLLDKASIVSEQIHDIKKSFQRVSKVLKGFDIPLDETTKKMDDLKQSLDSTVNPENIKVKAEDIDINSQMEVVKDKDLEKVPLTAAIFSSLLGIVSN